MTAKLEFGQLIPVVAEKEGGLHRKIASGTCLDSVENWKKYSFTKSKSHRLGIFSEFLELIWENWHFTWQGCATSYIQGLQKSYHTFTKKKQTNAW